MKPRLLITIYANPDYYPPTVYAVRLLSRYFAIHILCRNMDKPIEEWPPEVTIERIGEYASAGQKEAAGAGAKLIEYATFAVRTRALITQTQPAVVYSYDPHAFVASMLGRIGRRSIPSDISLARVAGDSGSFAQFAGGMGCTGGIEGYQVGVGSSISGKVSRASLANGRE